MKIKMYKQIEYLKKQLDENFCKMYELKKKHFLKIKKMYNSQLTNFIISSMYRKYFKWIRIFYLIDYFLF